MGKTTNDDDAWETPCPKREDKFHCNCWYEGDACCACGDPEDEGAQGASAVGGWLKKGVSDE